MLGKTYSSYVTRNIQEGYRMRPNKEIYSLDRRKEEKSLTKRFFLEKEAPCKIILARAKKDCLKKTTYQKYL